MTFVLVDPFAMDLEPTPPSPSVAGISTVEDGEGGELPVVMVQDQGEEDKDSERDFDEEEEAIGNVLQNEMAKYLRIENDKSMGMDFVGSESESDDEEKGKKTTSNRRRKPLEKGGNPLDTEGYRSIMHLTESRPCPAPGEIKGRLLPLDEIMTKNIESDEAIWGDAHFATAALRLKSINNLPKPVVSLDSRTSFAKALVDYLDLEIRTANEMKLALDQLNLLKSGESDPNALRTLQQQEADDGNGSEQNASFSYKFPVERKDLQDLIKVSYAKYLRECAENARLNRNIQSTYSWMTEFTTKLREKTTLSFSRPRIELEFEGASMVTFDDFCLAYRCAVAEINAMLSDGISKSLTIISVSHDMRQHIRQVRASSFDIQDSYVELYKSTYQEEACMDEMSITGDRYIRKFMEPPYFKSDLLTFELPSYGVKSHLLKLQENLSNDKWTTKDLQTLKGLLKENIVERKINFVSARYQELLEASISRAAEEREKNGQTLAGANPQLKRRRGRPTKVETVERDNYGVIYPVRKRTENVVEYYDLPQSVLGEWKKTEEARYRKMSYEALMEDEDIEYLIDWDHVASQLRDRTRKYRLGVDCKRAFEQMLNPKVKTSKVTCNELKLIKELVEVQKMKWDDVVRIINSNSALPSTSSKSKPKLKTLKTKANRPKRTFFQICSKYLEERANSEVVEWTKEMDDKLLASLDKYPAKWAQVAIEIGDERVNKKAAMERYKKLIPYIKHGAFSRIEDCLLVVAMNLYRDFIAVENNLNILQYDLYWRFETTWRDRAHNLFADWVVPWTIEEDRLLLELAETMNKNWQKISEKFQTFKNRKGCLTRYKILNRNVGPGKKHETLEQYHHAYSMTRYNVFQVRHLDEVLETLKTFYNLPTPKKEMELLDTSRPPSEEELKLVLEHRDKDVIKNCIENLEVYLAGRDKYWATFNAETKSTFDRRTFHPEDPQSVASAIHIRRLKLKPQNQFNDLNDFEKEIYMYFARFSQTKPLDDKARHPYLPPASSFYTWSAVSRLIAGKKITDPGPEENSKGPLYSKKWFKLMNEYDKAGVKKSKSRRGSQRTST